MEIEYQGWIPGYEDEREMWLGFGVRGPMIWDTGENPSTAYDPRWGQGAFSHCHASPSTMQYLIQGNHPPAYETKRYRWRLLPNPGSFTAIFEGTEIQLPRRYQLWGGAPVLALPRRHRKSLREKVWNLWWDIRGESLYYKLVSFEDSESGGTDAG